MIRLSLLAIYVAFFAAYAWKDWFRSLLALILLLAVIEHPDMPKSMMGIQGLSPWNLLLAVVVLAWLRARRREGLSWDLPRGIAVWLVFYLGVVLVGWVRMFRAPAFLDATAASMVSEQLINTIKWVIPAIMLYDGARNRERFRLGVIAVLGVYFLLAVQVIKWMPLSSALNGGQLSERSLKILINEIGFHRVNMSAMLAGASWAILAALPLARTRRERLIVLGASAAAVFGQALTAGRAGYVTWAAVGGVLCFFRWRKYLLLAPVVVVAVVALAPGVAERMLEGFQTGPTQTIGPVQRTGASHDVYAITAGRNLAWPLVIAKIQESPVFGYGREAMVRTGITAYLAQFAEGFSHPHNAYLEALLDNGLIGFLIIVPFYYLMLWKSISLFRDARRPIFVAIGGVSGAFLLALLVAAMGSQSFYPREGWAAMWGAMFLMLRIDVERRRVAAAAPARPEPAIHAAARRVRVAAGWQPAPAARATIVEDLLSDPADPPAAPAPPAAANPPRRPVVSQPGLGIATTFTPRARMVR